MTPSYSSSQRGFTLVELAIVLMIIGLLIGGILKGQELIQNARITSLIRQFKSYDAAFLTFMDSYGAKPGDITNPSTRLPNCTTAPCTNAGDGNGVIGINSTYNAENGSAWVHLAAANLISGIDTTKYAIDEASALIPVAFGGYAHIVSYNVASSAMYPSGVRGEHYLFRNPPSAADAYSMPLRVAAVIDRKIDDGKPWTGDAVIGSPSCGIASGATEYTSLTTSCSYIIKAGF